MGESVEGESEVGSQTGWEVGEAHEGEETQPDVTEEGWLDQAHTTIRHQGKTAERQIGRPNGTRTHRSQPRHQRKGERTKQLSRRQHMYRLFVPFLWFLLIPPPTPNPPHGLISWAVFTAAATASTTSSWSHKIPIPSVFRFLFRVSFVARLTSHIHLSSQSRPARRKNVYGFDVCLLSLCGVGGWLWVSFIHHAMQNCGYMCVDHVGLVASSHLPCKSFLALWASLVVDWLAQHVFGYVRFSI